MTKLQDLAPEEFKYLYSLMSQKRLAKTLGVTVNWVMAKVKKYEIEHKALGRPVEKKGRFKGQNGLPTKAIEILQRLADSGEIPKENVPKLVAV